MNSRDKEQQRALNAIRNQFESSNIALLQAATGYGKGHLVKKIAETVKGTLLVVAPRVNLVRDLAQRTGGSIYCASLGEKVISKVTIATKQSIKDVSADLVVLDECFTPEVEILTEDGFVRFDKLKNQKVASYDLKNENIKFEKPKRKIIKDYDGDIIHFKSDKLIDLRMTPNHEFLTTNCNGEKVKAFAKNINKAYYRKLFNYGYLSDKYQLISPFDRFQILFQADGSHHNKTSSLFSFSKERKIRRFLKICCDCNFKVSEVKSEPATNNSKEKRRFIVSHKNYKFYKNNKDYFNLLELDLSKAKQIVEEMVHWDGSVLNKESYYYSSVIRDNSDFYQEVAILSGYQTNLIIQKDNRKETYSDVFRLFIRKNSSNPSTQSLSINKENYKGKVYCVEVSTGNIIVRNNGKVLVTGNCHNYTEEFLETIDAKWIIGLTATPWNNDGYIYNQFFWPKPCYEFGIGDSIDAGYLSPYEIFGSKHAFDVQEYLKGRGDFKESEINEIVNQPKHEVQVKEIVQICEAQSRKKVAVLCANIDHAEKIHNEISKYEDCMIVHSRLKDSHKLIEEYKNNVTRFCVSVGMMSEGTDIPSIDCIVYLRPTKSSRLMVQSAGRGLRLHEDKKHCLLLDYGNVFINCGLPHNPIIPTAPGKKQEESEFPVRQCEACWYIYEAEKGSECPLCGHVTKTERDTEKNLKKSLLEKKEVKSVIVNSGHIYKRGIARNKLPYLTLKVDNKTYHTVFGKQVNWLLNSFGRNGCEIRYTHPFKIVDIKKL